MKRGYEKGVMKKGYENRFKFKETGSSFLTISKAFILR